MIITLSKNTPAAQKVNDRPARSTFKVVAEVISRTPRMASLSPARRRLPRRPGPRLSSCRRRCPHRFVGAPPYIAGVSGAMFVYPSTRRMLSPLALLSAILRPVGTILRRSPTVRISNSWCSPAVRETISRVPSVEIRRRTLFPAAPDRLAQGRHAGQTQHRAVSFRIGRITETLGTRAVIDWTAPSHRPR